LGHTVEKSALCAKLGGGSRSKVSGRESLRHAHIGQTLESWDFNELHALDCKSKKALAST
jgi:hypothetical protein